MGITTGGNISVAGIGNIVDLNVTGPATFNTDIWVGGNAYVVDTFTGKDAVYTGNLNVVGNLIYSNIEVVGTSNLIFTLGDNQTDPVYLNGGGIAVGNNNYATWLFNNATTSWQSNLTINPTSNGTLNLGGPVNTWNNLYVNNASIPGNLVGNNISGIFAGDGGNISNIQAANITGNVTSAQTVTTNAQPNITSVGTLTTLSVSGNVYATNLFGNITGLISNAIYANTAGNATTAATVTSNLQPNITLLGTLTTLSVNGNTITTNLFANVHISATGNVTGNYILGNGSQLTGLYANSNVVAYAQAGFAGNIIPSSNVTYSLGNSTNQWKDLWVSNNTIYLNSVPITLNSANILTVNGDNVVTANATGTSSTVGNVDITGNVTGGNIITAGYVSSTGNITGSYILGNGSQLTGLPAGYANANAQSYFSSGTSNANISITGNVLTTANVSATGNITGSYILGNGSQLTGLPAGYANANAAAYFASGNSTSNISITGNVLTTADVSATGNITGNYILGNGSQLSGISTSSNIIFDGGSNVSINSANANVTISVSTVANVVLFTPTLASITGNILTGRFISAGGNVTSGNVLTGGFVSATGNIIGGNLSVSGAISGSPTAGPSTANAFGYMGLPVNSRAGNSSAYTLVLTDQAKLIYGNVSFTVTVPTNASVEFPVGTTIAFAQYGAGTMSIAAASGVTIALVGTSQVGNRTLTSVGMASLTQVATNTWLITGTNVS